MQLEIEPIATVSNPKARLEIEPITTSQGVRFRALGRKGDLNREEFTLWGKNTKRDTEKRDYIEE